MSRRNCGVRSGLFRFNCLDAAIADCVYCDRPFCEQHGERGEDYEDVCARTGGRELLRDIRTVVAWRARGGEANKRNQCPVDGCEEGMDHQCVRCRLLFCRRHVRGRPHPRGSAMRVFDVVTLYKAHHDMASIRFPNLVRSPRTNAPGLVCGHCYHRLKVWN